jgi:hypothetical protein
MHLHFVRDMVAFCKRYGQEEDRNFIYINGKTTCRHYDEGTWETKIHRMQETTTNDRGPEGGIQHKPY